MTTNTDRASDHVAFDTGEMRRIHDRLSDQATLFDDPGAYLAGVEDALDAVVGRRGGDRLTVATRGITVTVEGAPARRSERARYIAALAVGLTTAGRANRDIVAELTDAADGCASLLQQAARCVYALRVGDPEHRRRAEALLLQAVIETRPRDVASRS